MALRSLSSQFTSDSNKFSTNLGLVIVRSWFLSAPEERGPTYFATYSNDLGRGTGKRAQIFICGKRFYRSIEIFCIGFKNWNSWINCELCGKTDDNAEALPAEPKFVIWLLGSIVFSCLLHVGSWGRGWWLLKSSPRDPPSIIIFKKYFRSIRFEEKNISKISTFL